MQAQMKAVTLTPTYGQLAFPQWVCRCVWAACEMA